MSSFSSHLILAHIIMITKGTTALFSLLYLGLTTSAFGWVLGQMVIRQTLPYGKIVTWKKHWVHVKTLWIYQSQDPCQQQVPYALTGHNAFALTRFLMKSFPLTGLSRAQRIFNYRLSRMRRISENCFGIIANRWRVFRAPILLPLDTVVDLILVALVLHNFLR